MAKQIKVIKCPQCGGNKPVIIDKDHYRCSKCDTEFILDSDDINVNVNHNYGRREVPEHSPPKNSSIIILVFFAVFIFLISAGINFVSKQFKNANNQTSVSASTAKSDIVFSVLLNDGGQATAFYLEDENTLLSDNG